MDKILELLEKYRCHLRRGTQSMADFLDSNFQDYINDVRQSIAVEDNPLVGNEMCKMIADYIDEISTNASDIVDVLRLYGNGRIVQASTKAFKVFDIMKPQLMQRYSGAYHMDARRGSIGSNGIGKGDVARRADGLQRTATAERVAPDRAHTAQINVFQSAATEEHAARQTLERLRQGYRFKRGTAEKRVDPKFGHALGQGHCLQRRAFREGVLPYRRNACGERNFAQIAAAAERADADFGRARSDRYRPHRCGIERVVGKRDSTVGENDLAQSARVKSFGFLCSPRAEQPAEKAVFGAALSRKRQGQAAQTVAGTERLAPDPLQCGKRDLGKRRAPDQRALTDLLHAGKTNLLQRRATGKRPVSDCRNRFGQTNRDQIVAIVQCVSGQLSVSSSFSIFSRMSITLWISSIARQRPSNLEASPSDKSQAMDSGERYVRSVTVSTG